MNETLDELLKHLVGKRFIDNFYITNITDNKEGYYDLDELVEYWYYKVVTWSFDFKINRLLITIER